MALLVLTLKERGQIFFKLFTCQNALGNRCKSDAQMPKSIQVKVRIGCIRYVQIPVSFSEVNRALSNQSPSDSQQNWLKYIKPF